MSQSHGTNFLLYACIFPIGTVLFGNPNSPRGHTGGLIISSPSYRCAPGLLVHPYMAGVCRRAWGWAAGGVHKSLLFACFSVANPGSRMCRRHPGRWRGRPVSAEKYPEDCCVEGTQGLLIQSKHHEITVSWNWRTWRADCGSSTDQPGTFWNTAPAVC